MKIAYVIDSTVVLHESLVNYPHIYKIPINITINNKEYLDGIDINNDELFEKMKEGKNSITTSLPSIGTFVELFEQLLQSYDYVIALMLSNELSGTYNSACNAAAMVSDKIKVVNTKLVSFPISYLLLKCIDEQKMRTLEELMNYVENLYKKNETYVVLQNLERLHKSGRLSDVSYYLGSLLKISPVIALQDGSLKVKEKVRTYKKAKDSILNYLQEAQSKSIIKDVAILYTANVGEAKKTLEQLKEQFTHIQFSMYPLGTAIAVHGGETTLGISWFSE